MSKDGALKQITSLMGQYQISVDEIIAFQKNHGRLNEASQGIVMRVLAYLGGLLIFAGVGIYVEMIWDGLPPLSRVLVTYGPGLIALVIGLICERDRRFVKAATPLFLMSGFLQPAGILVFLNEYVPGDDPMLGVMFTFGVLTLQNLVVFAKVRKTTLLFLTLAFGFILAGATMHWMEFDEDINWVILGTSIFCTMTRIDRTSHRGFVPFGYFVACCALLFSVFDILDDGPLDILLIGLAAGLMYLSTVLNSRTILVMSVIGFLGYLAYYTDEYFQDMVGWPVALILIGFIMIGLSSFAYKLGRRMKMHQDIRA